MKSSLFSKPLSALLLLSLTGLQGCENFSDKELKGILTVDKRQYGDVNLEVKDLDNPNRFFIHPGKKIISISKPGSEYELIIMDSKRVRLARLKLPKAIFNSKDETLVAKAYEIDQVFGVQAKRIDKIVREEYLVKRGKDCVVQQCDKSKEDCAGSTGSVWHSTDSRYDYTVYFMNDATHQPIGTFIAKGETRSAYEILHIKECRPKLRLFPNEDAFE